MKKFGKLRQWTDEKLGSSQKTVATEEFRDMEAEMHLRQQGLDSVYQASVAWMKALGKQIKTDNQEKEKGTPLDLLGIAMHGDDFAPESAYGQAMSKFGVSQQKIARLQDNFQQSINETVLLNMERSLAAMREFQNARKKLESRRLTYDSTLSKTQKAKKEDSKLEEELRAAKVRYEETSEDVHQRMLSIREAEANNLRDILDFIDMEADYFEQARAVIAQLRDDLQMDVILSQGGSLCWNNSLASSVNRTLNDIARSGDAEGQKPDCMTVRTLLAERTNNASGTDRKALLPARQGLSSFDHAVDFTDGPRRPPKTGNSVSKVAMTASLRETSHAQRRQSRRKVMLVKFPFQAEAENEVSVRAGERLEVLEEVSAGWWRGQIIEGSAKDHSRVGLFPVNYCVEYFETSSSTEDSKPSEARFATSDASRSTAHSDNQIIPPKSYTFPRTVRQVSAAYECKTQSTRTRPPPPPIPKKKYSVRDLESPKRNSLARS